MAFSSAAMIGYSLAISVASTAANYVGQQQQASAQNKANQGYATSESTAAAANAENQYGQAQQQIMDTDTQASQKMQAEDMQANAAKATAATNASARGVTGNSVDALQRDYTNRRDTFNADAEFNRTASDEEIMQQMKGIQLGTTSTDNQIQSQDRFVQGPGALSLVGGLAKDSASALDMYIKPQPTTPSLSSSQIASNINNGPSSADYAALDQVEEGIYP